MSDKIAVTIVITTFDPGSGERYALLYRTVQALVDNLIYSNLHWIVSDDSTITPPEVIEKLSKMIPGPNVSFFNTSRRGVGYSKNAALKEAFKISPITLVTEDDWILKEKLNLLPHVQLLLDHEDLGMVRFGFLGGSMTADYTDYGNFLTYWTLRSNSGFYVYSGQISLRHARFYSALGWHTEGITPGQEEEDFCWRYGQAVNPPKILWPAQYGSVLNCGPFLNAGIGTISTNNIAPEVK